MTDTYLFDGTDLATVARLASYEGLYEPPPLRGDDPAFAGRDGVLAVTKPFGVGVLTLQLVLLSDSQVARNDAIRAFTRAVKPGRTVTCTRQRTFSSGTESHEATVRYLSGLAPSMVGMSSRLAVTFEVLSGLWYTTTASSWSIASTGGFHPVTNPGDATARRITFTFPSSGSLVSDDGQQITVSGATTVDVVEQSATGGVTVTPQPDSTGGWFRLDPGVTNLNWGGTGTVTVDFYPAYV